MIVDQMIVDLKQSWQMQAGSSFNEHFDEAPGIGIELLRNANTLFAIKVCNGIKRHLKIRGGGRQNYCLGKSE
ncbi:hypothetical protein C2862_21195 [Massilia sp. Mn16-1_5]|nr:hypothetical protein C2862_21195 [Massilia sp. Mn16-1_5]